jgi:hypothetical protein
MSRKRQTAPLLPHSQASAPHADTLRLDDPQLATTLVAPEDLQQSAHHANHLRGALLGQTQHNQPWTIGRTIRSDIGEIGIERDEDAPFALADRGNVTIRPPRACSKTVVAS